MARQQAGYLYRSRRGLTLIEAALALMVAAVVMVGIAQMISGAAETTRARVTADRLQQVTAASQSYIQTNFAELYNQTAGGAIRVLAVATDGTSLRERGFLPSTYIDQNAYGQQHALIIRRVEATPPIPGVLPRLEGIVTTYGGSAIPDRQLGQIATFVGADAGFMLAVPPATLSGFVTGVNGGWSAQASQWSAGGTTPSTGRVMTSMAFNEGVLVGDYLNRRDIGIPEANRMRTNLDMFNNTIEDVATLTGSGNTVTLGADGAGTPWVDVSSNLTVGRDIVAGRDINAANNLYAANNVTAVSDVIGSRFVDRNDPSYAVDPASTSRINALNVAQISGSTVIASGAIGSQVLSGTLADRLPNYVAKAGYVVSEGAQRVPMPVCNNGGSPKITYASIQDSMRFASRVTYGGGFGQSQGQYIADLVNNEIQTARRYNVSTNGASEWLVSLQGTPQGDAGWSGLAVTYCYYP